MRGLNSIAVSDATQTPKGFASITPQKNSMFFVYQSSTVANKLIIKNKKSLDQIKKIMHIVILVLY